MIRLCVDPGHGMSNVTPGRYDAGAVSGRLLLNVAEADVVLQVALACKHVAATEFKSRVRVVLTRDDQTDSTPVGRRDDFAVTQDCDYLVSLHCNSPFPGTGTETFVANDATQQSLMLAAKVQRAALAAWGLRDRGIKRERQTRHGELAVLASQKRVPSCLLEIGFINHPRDLERMLSRDRRIAFAREMLAAILR